MPCPGAGLGIAVPQNCETPAGAGGWMVRIRVFVEWLAGARCPALRSAGLFGSETGSPRTRVAFLRHGYSRGPQYFLAEEMLGWVSRGWSESRTRPADLTPKKTCGRSRKKTAPRRGSSGIKRRLVKEARFLFFENCKDFRFSKNAHPGLKGDEGSTNLHRKRDDKVLRT